MTVKRISNNFLHDNPSINAYNKLIYLLVIWDIRKPLIILYVNKPLFVLINHFIKLLYWLLVSRYFPFRISISKSCSFSLYVTRFLFVLKKSYSCNNNASLIYFIFIFPPLKRAHAKKLFQLTESSFVYAVCSALVGLIFAPDFSFYGVRWKLMKIQI